AKPRLPRTNTGRNYQSGQSRKEASIDVYKHLILGCIDARNPRRLFVAANSVDVFSEFGMGIKDVGDNRHDHQNDNGNRSAKHIPLADEVIRVLQIRNWSTAG